MRVARSVAAAAMLLLVGAPAALAFDGSYPVGSAPTEPVHWVRYFYTAGGSYTQSVAGGSSFEPCDGVGYSEVTLYSMQAGSDPASWNDDPWTTLSRVATSGGWPLSETVELAAGVYALDAYLAGAAVGQPACDGESATAAVSSSAITVFPCVPPEQMGWLPAYGQWDAPECSTEQDAVLLGYVSDPSLIPGGGGGGGYWATAVQDGADSAVGLAGAAVVVTAGVSVAFVGVQLLGRLIGRIG